MDIVISILLVIIGLIVGFILNIIINSLRENSANRKVDIIVPENIVETFDAPNHNREEYKNMAFKLMEQSGIQLVKKYNVKG